MKLKYQQYSTVNIIKMNLIIFRCPIYCPPSYHNQLSLFLQNIITLFYPIVPFYFVWIYYFYYW